MSPTYTTKEKCCWVDRGLPKLNPRFRINNMMNEIENRKRAFMRKRLNLELKCYNLTNLLFLELIMKRSMFSCRNSWMPS